jgi:hypothetical protein
VDFSLRTPEGLSNVRAEGMSRNVVEYFLHLIKEFTEELGLLKILYISVMLCV